MELLYKIGGYRKPALMGDSSPNGLEVKMDHIPITLKKQKKEIDLSGGRELTQGRTSACGCATLCGIVQDILIRRTRKKYIELDWQEAWDAMKAMEIGGKNGSYLLDNLWFAQNTGYFDKQGNNYKVDKVEKIKRVLIKQYIQMGHQVYTGAWCGSPMIDKDYVFITGKRKYGHAFRIIGLTERDGEEMFLCETTWENYGYKKESQFFLRPSDVGRLMSCYVVTVA